MISLEENQEAFRKALEKSRGRALVLVHPFYTQGLDEYGERRLREYFDRTRIKNAYSLLKEYSDRLNKAIKETRMPVIVFEEAHKVNESHPLWGKENVFH